MSFRSEFLGAKRPLSELSFGRGPAGFEPTAELLAELRQAIKSLLESSVEWIRSLPGGPAFASEILHQLRSMEKPYESEDLGVWEVGLTRPPSEYEIADAIQRHCNYLGAQLSGIRWSAERRMSERSMRSLSKSMEHLYRQDFQTGIRLYDTKEYALSRECFEKALASTPTNYFAHQYLGLIAVHEDMPGEAINHFETAYKYAETETHRALALSHLARCQFALGKLDQAAAVAKSAAEVDDSAASWYEYATYSALSGDPKPVVPALVNAIQRDWVFWAVAIVAPQLDHLRAEISTQMNEIRDRIARKARRALDRLHDLVDGMQKPGGMDVGAVQRQREALERRYSENDVYQYRNLATAAEELLQRVSRTAREVVSERIAAQRRGLRKNEVWRDEQVGQLTEPVRRLRLEQHQLGVRFRVWNAGCFTYSIIWCLYMFLVVTFVASSTWKSIYVVPYVLSFVVPFALPAVVNALNYYLTVGRPRALLEKKIRTLEKTVNPAVEKIEKAHGERKEEITRDLDGLQQLLETIARVDAAA